MCNKKKEEKNNKNIFTFINVFDQNNSNDMCVLCVPV